MRSCEIYLEQCAICASSAELWQDFETAPNAPKMCDFTLHYHRTDVESYKKYPISPDNLKNTNLLTKCVISLPMHAYLSFEDIEYISKVAHDIINN